MGRLSFAETTKEWHVIAHQIRPKVPRQGAESLKVANLHIRSECAAKQGTQLRLLRVIDAFPQPVLITGDCNGMVARQRNMTAVAQVFGQTEGSLVDLPAPTGGSTNELGEPCIAGLYRCRGAPYDSLVMATWYCGRPRHLVRNKECDPHHSVLGLISLVDVGCSAVEPR